MPEQKYNDRAMGLASSVGAFGRHGSGGGHMSRGAPVIKPKNFKGTIRRLWGCFGVAKKKLFIVFAGVCVSSGIALTLPYLIGRAIDVIAPGNGLPVQFKMLGTIALVLGGAYITSAFVDWFNGFMMAGISQSVVAVIRQNLFDKFQKLPISFFDTNTHGDVMSRMTNDIDLISQTISSSTTQLMSLVITITGSVFAMLMLSPVLTLVAVVTIPLVFFVTKSVTTMTRKYYTQNQRELGALYGFSEEMVTGNQVVKAFAKEDDVLEEFYAIDERLCKVGIKTAIWSGFVMPFMNIINNISFTLIATAGGYMAATGMIQVGLITSFITYSKQFTRPLNDIATIYNTLQSAVAGAERVFEIIDEAEEPADEPDAIELTNPKGQVVFQNVSFGYSPDKPILKNVSFTAEPGSTTALVGPTGAGKTTIVNLLSRFYDVTEGSILIDGIDIRKYTRDSLRRCFGIVLQDPYLFDGTIRENLIYGRLDAVEDDVVEAAKKARAHHFINQLPLGYETLITESGSNLSQGQRQLLSIARAILADANILIFDEATSSVDTRTELRIQKAMLSLMSGRTSFLIAHRLSTIRDCDTIMVIDGGRIVERGNHESLLALGGMYANMYLSQLHKTSEDE